MAWNFKTKLDAWVTANPNSASGITLQLEIDRLNKQRCPSCSGFGHAFKDCPTDYKLLQLRHGVREQAKLVTDLRDAARKYYNLAA